MKRLLNGALVCLSAMLLTIPAFADAIDPGPEMMRESISTVVVILAVVAVAAVLLVRAIRKRRKK